MDFPSKKTKRREENPMKNFDEESNTCTPDDCWCSHYDNPYDNYYHSHHLNPAQRHSFWIQEWKKQFQEIHEDCKKLGQSSYSDEYVRGVLDTVSPEITLNTFTTPSLTTNEDFNI